MILSNVPEYLQQQIQARPSVVLQSIVLTHAQHCHVVNTIQEVGQTVTWKGTCGTYCGKMLPPLWSVT